MTVYVDNMEASYGRMIMCHCWADTREELFAMMDAIGVDVKWFQCPPRASWEHFDISKSKRAMAVAQGAVETDKFGPLWHLAGLDLASGDIEIIKDGLEQMKRIQKCRDMRACES